jgi:molybdopterin-guanine dinucleotide biosynthesis protein MobB
VPSASPQPSSETPPALCVVGRKNSGKTTLVVALTAELTRRGWRVATIKHGHHAFESDEPGRDSWRHFHEGGAEATIMCGTGRVALTKRIPGEPDPEELIRDFYSGRGYHLVLVEGWKHGPLPKLEIFRSAVHEEPVHGADRRSGLLAVATDQPERWAGAGLSVFTLDPAGSHVADIADYIERTLLAHAG